MTGPSGVSFLFNIVQGANAYTPFGVGSPTPFLVGSWVDNSGVLHASAPVTLAAGNQETGACGANFQAAHAGDLLAYVVNFKTRMTNIPSSITLTATGGAGNASVSTGLLTVDGFLFVITATVAGTSHWYGAYTTVGN
jgi:hypothetical protein